jgi:rubrerythrin
MAPALSFAEALAAAVKVEEAGIAFYKAAALNAIDPAAATLFLKLAEFEEQHRGYFTALGKRLENKESLFAGDARGEFAASLAEMAASGVFDLKRDIGDFFIGRETPRSVVKTAIGMEKDSIVFYLGLEQAMTDPVEAKKLSAVIGEEMRHISVLAALLKQMN